MIFKSKPILVTLLLIAVAILQGCAPVEQKTASKRIENPALDMMDYLFRSQVLALESVVPWENPYGPGLELETKNYRVYTTLLDPLILNKIPAFLESAFESYNRQLPESITAYSKFDIYLFETRHQWEDFTEQFAGRYAPVYRSIKAGAYVHNGSCVAYNIGRQRTFAVLGHEGWHQFNQKFFTYRLPSWLDEGIAMLFETSSYKDGKIVFDPAKNYGRLAELRRTMQSQQMLPLSVLLSINPGEVLSSENTASVSAFYSQAYALVRFLREEGYGKYHNNYQDLLLAGLDGTWPLSDDQKKIAADRNTPLTVQWNRKMGRKLFDLYIQENFDIIEQQYISFCKKLVYDLR